MDDYFDRYADEIPDEYLINRTLDEQPVQIDTRSLQRQLRKGFKKVDSYEKAEVYFGRLSSVIKSLGKACVGRALVKSGQQILDGYVRYNQDQFDYNDYYGGITHNYFARVIVGGKQKSHIRVSDNILPWGKPLKNDKGKRIFKLLRRRHAVIKHYENVRYHVNHSPEHSGWNYGTGEDRKKKFGYSHLGSNYNEKGERTWWMDRELNARGRRLKGRKGGKFRYRVRSDNRWSKGGYEYKYYYGKSMLGLYKKYPDRHPKDVEVKRNVFRYENAKIDREAKKGFRKNQLGRGRFRSKTGIEIYNAAPYAGMLQKHGYNVLPGIKVRSAWKHQILTLTRRDFDRFLKKL